MKNPYTRNINAETHEPVGNPNRGVEAALVMAFFFGIGWLVDGWVGTWPVFAIGLLVFAAVGSFVRMKYDYDGRMEEHEARRREAASSRGSA